MKKKILGIMILTACISASALLISSCGSKTENNASTPQPTADQVIDGQKPTEQPIQSTAAPQQTQITTPSTAGQSDSKKPAISSEAAKKIALNHAGISQDKVQRYKSELDFENGRLVYEIEFESQGFEYDYEVNANTGAIVKAEKERD